MTGLVLSPPANPLNSPIMGPTFTNKELNAKRGGAACPIPHNKLHPGPSDSVPSYIPAPLILCPPTPGSSHPPPIFLTPPGPCPRSASLRLGSPPSA